MYTIPLADPDAGRPCAIFDSESGAFHLATFNNRATDRESGLDYAIVELPRVPRMYTDSEGFRHCAPTVVKVPLEDVYFVDTALQV